MMVIVMMVVVGLVSGWPGRGEPLRLGKHIRRKSHRAHWLGISMRRRPRTRLFAILDSDTAHAAELVTFTVLITADPARYNFRIGSQIARQIRRRSLNISLGS
jgi:hypothetical protein